MRELRLSLKTAFIKDSVSLCVSQYDILFIYHTEVLSW